jgi:galactokinase
MTEGTLFREAKNFFQAFEPRGEIITGVKVPGSIQVLGEVNELNRGRVIAGNINKSALLMAQKRKEGDRAMHFYSQKYDEKIRMMLNDPQAKEDNGWANYVASSLFMLESMSKRVPGMNVYIDNEIPDSFLADSMEALEVGMANVAGKLSDWNISPVEAADICASGEANFMHKPKNPAKFIPLLTGKKGTMVFYDSVSGENAVLETPLKGLNFVVLSSGVKKKSIELKKQAIFAEINESIDIINKNGGNISTLDQLTLEKFDDYRSKLSITQRKKCAFFISENERDVEAKKALLKKDLNGFLEVINDSQRNIVSRLDILSDENELLIDMINDIEGIKAVRLLNLGLDGTVLAVIDGARSRDFETKIKKTFLARTGLGLEIEVFDLQNEMSEFNINVTEFSK